MNNLKNFLNDQDLIRNAFNDLPNLKNKSKPCEEVDYIHFMGYLDQEFYTLKHEASEDHLEGTVDKAVEHPFYNGHTKENVCYRCGKIMAPRTILPILPDERKGIAYPLTDPKEYFEITLTYEKEKNKYEDEEKVINTAWVRGEGFSISEQGNAITNDILDGNYFIIDETGKYQKGSNPIGNKVIVFPNEIKIDKISSSTLCGVSFAKNINLTHQNFYKCNYLKIVIFRGSRDEWQSRNIPNDWLLPEYQNTNDDTITGESINTAKLTISDNTQKTPWTTTWTIDKYHYLMVYLEDPMNYPLPRCELVPYISNEKEFIYGELNTDKNVEIQSSHMGQKEIVPIYCNFGLSNQIGTFDIILKSNDEELIQQDVNIKTITGASLQEDITGVQLFLYDKRNNTCYFFPEYPYYS